MIVLEYSINKLMTYIFPEKMKILTDRNVKNNEEHL